MNENFEKYELAFQLVFVEGLSYRQASKQLGCVPETAKRWALKGRAQRRAIREKDERDDYLSEWEAKFQRLERRAWKALEIAEASDNGNALVGAINAIKALHDQLVRVRGLEAPKHDKTDLEGRIEIVWGEE